MLTKLHCVQYGTARHAFSHGRPWSAGLVAVLVYGSSTFAPRFLSGVALYSVHLHAGGQVPCMLLMHMQRSSYSGWFAVASTCCRTWSHAHVHIIYCAQCATSFSLARVYSPTQLQHSECCSFGDACVPLRSVCLCGLEVGHSCWT